MTSSAANTTSFGQHLKLLLISEHLLQDLLSSVFISLACFIFGATPFVTLYIFATLLVGQFSIDISNNYFDRHTDKLSGQKHKVLAEDKVPAKLAIRIALIFLVLSVGMSLFIPAGAGYIHIIALAIAWAYNLGLKKTPLSILCYMVAFSLTPVFVTIVTSKDTTLLVMATFAIFGAVAHFAEAIKDYHYDTKVGNRAFPTIFPLATSKKILTGLVILLLFLSIFSFIL